MKFIKSKQYTMKKLLFVFTMLLIGCVTFAQTSPCDDPKFLDLKKKGVANLTESEMSYYAQKDKECDQFTKSQKVDNSTEVAAANNRIDQKNKQEKATRNNNVKSWGKFWFWMAAIVGLLVYGSKQGW